jgi:hypothetical protein
MKTQLLTIAAALVMTTALPAQKLDLKLDHLIPLAKEHVVIDMDGAQIKAALAAMPKDAKEGKLGKGIPAQAAGIEVLQVRTFEFENEGAYKPSDLEDIRRQMGGTGWSKIVSVRETKESVDVFLMLKDGEAGGIAVLAAEPKELTVVHILGKLNVKDLQAMVNSKIAFDLAELQNRK